MPPIWVGCGNLNFLNGKSSGNFIFPRVGASALGECTPREQFCNLRLSRRCFFIIRTVCFPAFSFQSVRSIAVPAHNDTWVCAPTVSRRRRTASAPPPAEGGILPTHSTAKRGKPPRAVIARRKNAAKLLRFQRGNLNFLNGRGSGNFIFPRVGASALGECTPREQFCDLRLSRRCFFIIRTVCFPAFSLQSFRSIAVPAHNDA